MRTIFLLSIFLFFFIIENTNAQSGLVACYPLDNNANDFSGNNYNGITNNVTPTVDRFGNVNSAYNFSGSGSYVDLPFVHFLLNEYSYSVWCRPTNLPAIDNFFSIIAIGGVDADQPMLLGNKPNINYVGFGGGSYDTLLQPHSYFQGFLPMVNQWYHLVMTRENDSLHFYVNDTLVGVVSVGDTTAGYHGSTLVAYIGARETPGSQYFKGDIDDVRIYSRALSLTEIQYMNPQCETTDVNEHFGSDHFFNIYPNPINGNFNITLTKNIKEGIIYIFNAIGEKVYSEIFNGSQETIHCKLGAGIYFIQVTNGNETWARKVICE